MRPYVTQTKPMLNVYVNNTKPLPRREIQEALDITANMSHRQAKDYMATIGYDYDALKTNIYKLDHLERCFNKN